MGEYLAKKGHRRVAHVTGPSFFREAMARADGFEQGLAEQRRDRQTRRCASRAAISRRRGAKPSPGCSASTAANLPSAVFFAQLSDGVGRARRVLRPRHPRAARISRVAVFDELPQLEYVRPKLTRVGNSPTALARPRHRNAARTACRQVRGPAAHRDHPVRASAIRHGMNAASSAVGNGGPPRRFDRRPDIIREEIMTDHRKICQRRCWLEPAGAMSRRRRGLAAAGLGRLPLHQQDGRARPGCAAEVLAVLCAGRRGEAAGRTGSKRWSPTGTTATTRRSSSNTSSTAST